MNEDDRRWIDEASYEDLLRRWRYAPPGDPIFVGETGQHYLEQMRARGSADLDAAVAASKKIDLEREVKG